MRYTGTFLLLTSLLFAACGEKAATEAEATPEALVA